MSQAQAEDRIMENIQNNLIEKLNLASIVALINHKYAVNCDNHEKAEVITEILNDIKLLTLEAKGGIH